MTLAVRGANTMTKVIMEGWMHRYGRRRFGCSFFHKRYFVLESGILAYYKWKPSENSRPQVALKSLVIDGCRVEDRGLETRNGHSFYVLSVYNEREREHRITMAALTSQKLTAWKESLEHAIEEVSRRTMARWEMPGCELPLAKETGKPEEEGIALLGSDQLLAVLRCLPIQSLISFGMTCKRYKAVTDTDGLWALICKREWGSRAVDAWPSAGRHKLGWKRLYQQMLVLNAVAWHRLDQGDLVPVPRASHSMCFVNGHLTLFGGGCYGGRHLDDSWVAAIPEYPPECIAWQQMYGGGPSGRFGQCCCVVGNILIVFGGIDDKGTRLGDTWISRKLAGCQEEEPTWQLLEVGERPAPRGAHAGCFAGDRRAVIFGGIASDGTRLGDTWVLDLAEVPHCWREIVTPIAPRPRSGHTLTWLGGKRMILFGGRGVDFEVMNDVWILNMESEYPTWVELQASGPHSGNECPAPRAGHSATLIFGERILIFGGEDSRRARRGDVWVLDPRAKLEVAPIAPCRGSLSRHGTVANASTSKYSRRFWKRLKQFGRPPCRRSFHAACAVEGGHVVLIFGGMVDGELKPAAPAGLGFDAELLVLQLVP